jgi:hypothetical protein
MAGEVAAFDRLPSPCYGQLDPMSRCLTPRLSVWTCLVAGILHHQTGMSRYLRDRCPRREDGGRPLWIDWHAGLGTHLWRHRNVHIKVTFSGPHARRG